MTFDEAVSEAPGIANRLAEELGVGHVNIVLIVDKEPDDDGEGIPVVAENKPGGDCHVLPEYNRATIRVHWQPTTDLSGLEDTILHELIHVVAMETDSFAELVMKSIPERLHPIVHESMRQMDERLNVSITRMYHSVRSHARA